jgi:hypothetical protein
VRFTRSVDGSTLYAVVLDPPPSAMIVLPGVGAAQVTSVRRLGYGADLAWDPHPEGITVTLPEPPAPTAALAVAVRQGAAQASQP